MAFNVSFRFSRVVGEREIESPDTSRLIFHRARYSFTSRGGKFRLAVVLLLPSISKWWRYKLEQEWGRVSLGH